MGTVPLPDYRYILGVPGEVDVLEASAQVEAVPKRAFQVAQVPRVPQVAHVLQQRVVEVEVDAAGLEGPLAVRNWRPGDALRPAGLSGGRKKLQDIFVDAKVPRQERRLLPLLVDGEDHVLWVPGLAIDRRLRVTGGTKAVVVLRLTRNPALPVGGPE